ncbi:LexA family protein [Legionella tunisiensis]|uniref:LexA family protein n=1 Tax=Legionella tunisiensis TaxID=1034944 RepID=UPI000318243E|nr:translesion error-prone DNA polymerase V autoproteolytic subunit [Legionella tunisiensis]
MPRGGKREGSGRPKGSNIYGESTHPLRIPASRLEDVKAFLASGVTNYAMPLFASTVRAGTPTSADDYIEDYIDLNTHFSKQPGSTFLVTASGDSMINANIQDGDMLVVNKDIKPTHGKIVIASVAGELTVKRLAILPERIHLVAENPNYLPIVVNDETSLVILGVVTHIIHSAT